MMKVVAIAVTIACCPAVGLAQSDGGPSYAWRLRPSGYELVFGLGDAEHIYYRLPVLHAFDRAGRHVEVLAPSERTGGEIIDRLVATVVPKGEQPSRRALAEHIRPLSDRTLPETGDSLELFVFSATWCAPCHRLVKEFESAVATNPEVVILVVEADLLKEDREVQVSLLGRHLNPPSEWQKSEGR